MMGKLLSMTGYGSARGTVDGQMITVELKSVNNRFLDQVDRLTDAMVQAQHALEDTADRLYGR